MAYKLLEFNEVQDDLAKLAQSRLIDLQTKYIAKIQDTYTQQIYDLAQKAGFVNVILGSRRGATLADARERIEGMSKSWIERPIKIVLTNDGRAWADNTHWTLSYIKKYGADTLVQDVPFYIVDLRGKTPQIVSFKDSVKNNKEDIRAAITAAQVIEKYLKKGLRPAGLGYTVNRLFKEIYPET